MNFFEKMKLKALLRNCNYELAGEVLKQQFYDEEKNTELNRLIDTLIEQPCFENALQIIKKNEMYVFYFTESCHDGLYVRKGGQTPLSATGEEQVAVSEVGQAQHNDHRDEQTENLPHTQVKEIKSVDRSGPFEKEHIPSSEGHKSQPRVQFYEQAPPKQEKQFVEKESLKSSIKESLKKLVREAAEMEDTSVKKESPANSAPVQHDETIPSSDEPIQPELSRFKNVIATLQIDIEEMKQQREEYQQLIFNNDPRAVKLKRWIVSLDEAIEEFSQAVVELNRMKK